MHVITYLESMAKKRRKFGCAFSTLDVPAVVPASLRSSMPSGSRTEFRRSKTVGLQRLALSSKTQCPCSMAVVSEPSIHSNLQVEIQCSFSWIFFIGNNKIYKWKVVNVHEGNLEFIDFLYKVTMELSLASLYSAIPVQAQNSLQA